MNIDVNKLQKKYNLNEQELTKLNNAIEKHNRIVKFKKNMQVIDELLVIKTNIGS